MINQFLCVTDVPDTLQRDTICETMNRLTCEYRKPVIALYMYKHSGYAIHTYKPDMWDTCICGFLIVDDFLAIPDDVTQLTNKYNGDES